MSGKDEKPDRVIELEENVWLRDIYRHMLKELTTERERYRELEMDALVRAEDMASPLVETIMSALAASRDMFAEYYDPRSRWTRLGEWLRSVWER